MLSILQNRRTGNTMNQQDLRETNKAVVEKMWKALGDFDFELLKSNLLEEVNFFASAEESNGISITYAGGKERRL